MFTEMYKHSKRIIHVRIITKVDWELFKSLMWAWAWGSKPPPTTKPHSVASSDG